MTWKKLATHELVLGIFQRERPRIERPKSTRLRLSLAAGSVVRKEIMDCMDYLSSKYANLETWILLEYERYWRNDCFQYFTAMNILEKI